MKGRLTGFCLSLLALRTGQVWRSVRELGVLRAIVLLIFGVYSIVLLSKLYFTASWSAGAAAAVTILMIHLSRKDRRFLAFAFGRYGRQAMILEYIALGLPCCIYYLYSANIAGLGILMSSIFLIPFIDPKPVSAGKRTALTPLFPQRAFELRSSFRANWFVVFAALLAGLVFCRQVVAPVLSMLVITLVYAFSTSRNESRLMLETFGSAGELLRYKITCHLRALLVFLWPLAAAFLWFHFSYWYLLAGLLIVCCVVSVLSILLKYAFYRPGEDAGVNQLLTGLSVACFLIVYLAPVPFIMLPVYYRKAKKNLRLYF